MKDIKMQFYFFKEDLYDTVFERVNDTQVKDFKFNGKAYEIKMDINDILRSRPDYTYNKYFVFYDNKAVYFAIYYKNIIVVDAFMSFSEDDLINCANELVRKLNKLKA